MSLERERDIYNLKIQEIANLTFSENDNGARSIARQASILLITQGIYDVFKDYNIQSNFADDVMAARARLKFEKTKKESADVRPEML